MGRGRKKIRRRKKGRGRIRRKIGRGRIERTGIR